MLTKEVMSKVAYKARAYPNFSPIVPLLSPGWDTSPLQSYLQY